MDIRKIALGVMGLGALLIVFGFAMWFANKPDFSGELARREQHHQQNTGRPMHPEDRRQFMATLTRNEQAYRGCLFSSQVAICQFAPATPYLNIGGILLIVAGAGLFMFSRRRVPA